MLVSTPDVTGIPTESNNSPSDMYLYDKKECLGSDYITTFLTITVFPETWLARTSFRASNFLTYQREAHKTSVVAVAVEQLAVERPSAGCIQAWHHW